MSGKRSRGMRGKRKGGVVRGRVRGQVRLKRRHEDDTCQLMWNQLNIRWKKYEGGKDATRARRLE